MENTNETSKDTSVGSAPVAPTVLPDSEYFVKSSAFFEDNLRKIEEADTTWKPERLKSIVKVFVPPNRSRKGKLDGAPEEQEVNKPQEPEEVEISSPPKPPAHFLVHYTTEEGFKKIVEEHKIIPSDKGREGFGVYFTSLNSNKMGRTAVLINNYDRASGSHIPQLKYGVAVYGLLPKCKPCFMTKTYSNDRHDIDKLPNYYDMLAFVRERDSVVHEGPVYLQGCKDPETSVQYYWHFFRF